MKYDLITDDRQLRDFCAQAAQASTIAFDTEFVSEDTYRPDLCLIQVAAAGKFAIIDPKAGLDLDPFWRLIAVDDRETIVHAGREEFRFCAAAVGRRPGKLFDIQIAAGLVGLEYPAALSTIIYRLLGKTLGKGETRTNWRHRPLSPQQLTYAVQDVVHLHALRDTLHEQLDKLGRLSWLAAEMASWQEDVEAAEVRTKWRRVSGIAGLSPRNLAIVRELWRWRESVASDRDTPAKRVLRDDLIVELARRKTADPKQIRALRGMEHGHLRHSLDDIATAIDAALKLPESELPRSERRELPAQLTVLGQFLATAIGNLCRAKQLAGSLVASVQDVRDLIAYRLGYFGDDEKPALAEGWRAEVVGTLVDDLLAGRLTLRVRDPRAEEPLVFERYTPAE